MALLTADTFGPAELAIAVEERGLSSLFLGHHTHIPTSRRTPYPAGGELKPEFGDLYDPLIALAAAASVTSKIELGTGVLLVAQQNPIVLAKQLATLDIVSGGRLALGIGFGWNEDEMSDHGVDPATRRAAVRETVLMLKTVWSNEQASFHGAHIRLAESRLGPKPMQSPHPPILMGGAAGPTLFHHVVEYCDGWMPIGGAELANGLMDLRREAERVGRDISTLSINVFGSRPDPARLERYVEMGVDRVILTIPGVDRFSDVRAPSRDETLPVLDEYAAFAQQHGFAGARS